MKAKTTLYLRAETMQALTNFLERHVSHLRSKSDAADYLLRVALDNTACGESTQRSAAAAYDDLARIIHRGGKAAARRRQRA